MLSPFLICIYVIIFAWLMAVAQLPFEETLPWMVAFSVGVVPLLFVATWVNLYGF
jgi:hypothetical protein